MTHGDREPRARTKGFRAAARLGAALLLAFGPLAAVGMGASPAPASAASVRVESAWTGSVGAGGANGKVTVRAFDTGAGSVVLALRRLTPATGYTIAIHRGTCASPGTRIVSAGTLKTTASGTLATTRALTAAQVAAIRLAATGTRRISVKVGSGATARCATLAKSLAVTPQIWFAPLPPMPIREGRPFIGSTDFAALFAGGAPWQRVAGRTHVFKLYGEWLDGTATDAELRRVVAGLKARDIAIAIEIGPLTAAGCGEGIEGFNSGSATTLRLIRRIVAAGGTVRYVAMDEPFFFGSLYTGPNACRWSTAKVAAEVARYVREVKAAYPSIIIGDIEPFAGTATAAKYEAWMAAVRAAVGAPLPFFHLDLDWSRSDWAASSLRLQAYARGHGVRFGIIYNSALASSDAEWLAAAQAHVLTHELEGAGPPDDAIFQSWNDHPDRVLPETGSATFTHLIADYIRTRTTLSIEPPVAAGGGLVGLAGFVRTRGGAPIGGAPVDVTATPRDGPYQVLEFRGTVPAGVSEAVIGIRVNTEGAGPRSADLTFYEVGYAEGASTANLVPNGHFEWGWGASDDASVSVPSDRGTGMMLRVVATPAQAVGDNSDSFAVTPGAAYRFWLAVRVPEASVGSAYIAPIFLTADWSEVRRDIHPLAAAAISVGTATADASGRFSLTTSAMDAGRYSLQASYPGDAARWPAWAKADALVP